ncbi:hypothetical protein FOA52_014169 [Chlamydomonas sp. UWO 241]|nr:hypothetical protein FOA52_014169 [Chlamydomonas sp. UWO 241]
MILSENADNVATIAAAGAIPSLVQLLKATSAAEVQLSAAGALHNLAQNADNQVMIAAAGSIPPLVQLLGTISPSGVQRNAAATLMILSADADNQVTIAAAGAIPPLVLLLRPGSDDLLKEVATRALETLGHSNTKNRAAVAVAGASAGVDVLEKMERLQERLQLGI